jgi:hypothetical protein
MLDRTSQALQKEMGTAPSARSEDEDSESGEEDAAPSGVNRKTSPALSGAGKKATVEDGKNEGGDYEDVAL